MLSRLFARSLTHRLKTLTLVSSSHSPIPSSLPNPDPFSLPKPFFLLPQSLRFFSSNGNGDDGGDGSWGSFFDDSNTSVFGEEEVSSPLSGIVEESEASKGAADPWLEEKEGDIFAGIEKESLPTVGGGGGGGDGEWETAQGYKPWSLGGEDGDGVGGDLFDVGEVGGEGIEGIGEGDVKSEEQIELERKEQELLATLKGIF